MRVMAVIPSKPSSERIPNKSRSEINGQSLVDLAFNAASNAYSVTDAFICGVAGGGHPHIPWPEDSYDIAALAQHALKYTGIDYDYVVTLLPTCPCRTPGQIDDMIREVSTNKLAGGVSVCPTKPWLWTPEGKLPWTLYPPINPLGYRRSQDLPTMFQEINSCQIARADQTRIGKRWGYPLALQVLPPYAAIDIDTPTDLVYAREHLHNFIEMLRAEQFTYYHIGPDNL